MPLKSPPQKGIHCDDIPLLFDAWSILNKPGFQRLRGAQAEDSGPGDGAEAVAQLLNLDVEEASQLIPERC